MTLHVKHYIENKTLIKISHCRVWWSVWRQRTISWKQEVLHPPLSFLAAHLLLPPPSHLVWPASWTATKPIHPWASPSPSASASMSASTLVSSCSHSIWYLNIKTCWLLALHPITNLAYWVNYWFFLSSRYCSFGVTEPVISEGWGLYTCGGPYSWPASVQRGEYMKKYCKWL